MLVYKAKIKGMHCGHCTMKVKKALEKAGLEDVEVSLDDALARFKSEDEVFFDEVERIIKEAGYELVELEKV